MQMTYLLKASHPSDDIQHAQVSSGIIPSGAFSLAPALRDRSESQTEFDSGMRSAPQRPIKVSKFGSQFFHGDEGSALQFQSVNLTLKKGGTKLLSNVTAVCAPGRVMALMGPSGAGKTALLDVIFGNHTGRAAQQGEVLFNNAERTPQTQQIGRAHV